MGTMERILRLMADNKASDVYLSANAPALVKIQGECIPLNNQTLTPDAPRSLLAEIVPPERIEELDETGELNMGVPLNGVGRFLWGGVSDKIGRVQIFRLILASQLIAFIGLIFIKSPIIFSIMVCYILLCYGGGFGAMPSFVLDVFGAKYMAVVYGSILTAWGCGGIVGPQLIAFLKDHFAAQAAQYTFIMASVLLLTGLLLTLGLNNGKAGK